MKQFSNSVHSDPAAVGQFLAAFKRKLPLEPEKELMFAVLTDAIDCYWKHRGACNGVGGKLFREAQDWLHSEDDEHPFSFKSVCETLGLDSGYLRRGIVQSRLRRLVERPGQHYRRSDRQAGKTRRLGIKKRGLHIVTAARGSFKRGRDSGGASISS